jgi:hypothetical protein
LGHFPQFKRVWLPQSISAIAIYPFLLTLTPVRSAFKEWSVVVDALAAGRQILLLRKGGIAEPRGGFCVEHDQFLLFPTRFHQQRAGVIDSAQARFDELEQTRSLEDRVRISHMAEVVSWRKIASLDQALRLEGQHVWRQEVIQERFDWGRESAIHAMALRVRALRKPVDFPLIPSYGGCRSWVEMAEEVDADNAEAVLRESEFTQRLAQFETILGADLKS